MAKKHSERKPAATAPTIKKEKIKPVASSTQVNSAANTSGNSTSKSFWSSLPLATVLLFILIAVAIAVNFNTLNHGFVLDDVMVIKDNKIVKKGISAVPELLATPHLKGYLNLGNDTYRPLSLVLFAVLQQFFPDNSTCGHFFNILFFAGCVAMFFLFLNRLFKGQRTALAFIAALLFAVHPIHTEVSANIKSMDELMCFFFAFTALYFFVLYQEKGNIMMLGTGLFTLFLSYLSKETVIAFLAFVPFVFFLYLNEDRKKSVIIGATATGVAIIFLALRWKILTDFKANVHNNINFVDNFLTMLNHDKPKQLATAIMVMLRYFKLLVMPYPLISDYSYKTLPYVDFLNIEVIISVLFHVGLLALAVLRLIKLKKDPLALGIAYYFFTMALFSNIFFLIGSGLAERFLFFASAGFCIMLAFIIENWVAKAQTLNILTDKKVLALLIPITLLLFGLTVERNKDWESDYTLYKADIEKAPDNIRLAYDYSNEMVKVYNAETNPARRLELLQQSKNSLRHALVIYPNYADAQMELGIDFFNEPNFDSARAHFLTAIALNPRQSNAMFNLAIVFDKLKMWDSSLYYYKKTIVVNPDRFPAIFNEAVAYYNLQKFDSAIIDFKKSLALSPEYYGYKGYGYVAILYRYLGNADSTKKYEALAHQFEPGFKMP
jgi:protein O-mannosyl-transferase